MSVYQKAHDLESTLSLFDRAVDCWVAQTDVYNDVMSSCMDSKKYKVCSSAVLCCMLCKTRIHKMATRQTYFQGHTVCQLHDPLEAGLQRFALDLRLQHLN